MSENPISITSLNDFIFCPASIYFHSLELDESSILEQDIYQINGSAVHEKIDNAGYSTKKSILQGTSVYSDRYNLYGKIDIFDTQSGVLTERKKKITAVYDGYIFQLYGQYFCLEEMGYKVNVLRLLSLDDNRIYKIDLPNINVSMFEKFETLLNTINDFNLNEFIQENTSKCDKCIYEPLCSCTLKIR